VTRRAYVFADEFGNFDFSRNQGASRYYAVGTVTLFDDEPAALRHALHELRTRLAWKGIGLDSAFHATTDRQDIRDEVYKVLLQHPLRIDVTILEKSKAQPHTRKDEPTFYKFAWYYHLKHLAARRLQANDRLLLSAAELGTRKKRAAFRAALQDVCAQCAFHLSHQVAFWPFHSEPCLGAADYALWAVMRKWERGDPRSHDLIQHQVGTQFDLWAVGTVHYY
jgi:hypothetical protein